MINRAFFFDQVRISLFGGKLTQDQTSGLATLLDMWEPEHAIEDDRWLAYMLGTTHHETDRRMQPIDEYGSNAYFEHRYGPTGADPALAAQLGNDRPGDGARYHGRGYVQLTGRRNYRELGQRIGVSLVEDPDRAKEPRVAAQILWIGMSQGLFTGRALDAYFDRGREDWRNARRIINRLDKADLVADYAKRYYAAISHTT